jgi:glycosyltransferase involved in cell wall biosynthesis
MTYLKKIRVAIVVSHPIQQFVHLYKAIAKDNTIELKVFFASNIGVKPYFDKDMNTEIKWASDLLAGYDHEFLTEADSINETGFWQINNPSIISALKTFSPGVVQLHGYAQLTMLRAILWCSFKRIPVILSADSSLLFLRAAWKQFLKDLLLPWFLRLFYGVISTGDNNAAYFKHYGVKSERIFICPFTVDENLLGHARDERSILRKQYRAKYAIEDDEIMLLFVGKLVPWKRPQDLLDALSLAQAQLGLTVKLVAFFAGDGAMREALEHQVNSQNLRAIFAGFINVDVLPSIYAMSDVLVFPSERDAYGLSAREAICVGLPLIVSDQIGCVGPTDAARPDFNALVYPSLNASLLAKTIVSLVSHPNRLKQMSEASLQVAIDMGPNKSVAGFLSAVKDAFNSKKR